MESFDMPGIKGAVEAILFAVGEPISASKIAELLELDTATVTKLIRSIREDCEQQERGLTLLRLDDKYQFSTKAAYGEQVKRAVDTRRNTPLSSAAMEVLAIIAYNQPVSRSFVEQIRGVDSSSSISSLISKDLIREAGRLDLPGRPISYRTTDSFLRCFGMSGLSELPSLHEDEPDYSFQSGE